MAQSAGTTPSRSFRIGALLLIASLAIEVIDWWSRLEFLRQKLTSTAFTNVLFSDGSRLLLLVVGLLLVILGRSDARAAVTPPAKPTPEPLPALPIEVTIDELLDRVNGKTDLAALEALRTQYHPFGVLVTGHLAGVAGSFLYGDLVNSTGDARIQVVFASKWRSALAQVHPGQMVTVSGKIKLVQSGEIRLDECDLVRVVPGSEANYKPYAPATRKARMGN